MSYLGLGGVAGREGTKTARKKWFDRVFEYLDKIGFKGKIHGFGVTAPKLIEEFPWTSVDSSSWIHGTAHGSLFIYDKNNDPKFKSYIVSELRKKHLENVDYILERTRVNEIEIEEGDLFEHWTRRLINFNNWLEYVNYLKKKKRRML